MINKLQVLISNSFDPYYNLALEEYLLSKIDETSCILYLWQNENTVVIGKNQNAWKECRIEELERDGGRLARRLSGGGAVFHDRGNLNFTFLVQRENYDLHKQLSVICKAAEMEGIEAEFSGRNDLTASGRKFSGNAFYMTDTACYHHGTILVNVDQEKLSRYLNVSHLKLQSKGVDSVKSRVINLTELSPKITIASMKETMIRAAEQIYAMAGQNLEINDSDCRIITNLCQKYSSREWRLGRNIPFQSEGTERFCWGEVTVRFDVKKGIINSAGLFSDAMDASIIEKTSEALNDKEFSGAELIGTMDALIANESDESRQQILNDIKELILKKMVC